MEGLARPVDLEPRLDGLLRIKNFYWTGPVFRPLIESGSGRDWLATLGALRGQFGIVLEDGGARRITFVRDSLGINKLFFAIHRSGRVSAANYLLDLIKRGVPCEAVYSVPSGCALQIDVQQGTLVRSRYFSAGGPGAPRLLRDIARSMRRQLDTWFTRLAAEFRHRRIFVCLSGGVDSGVIAAFARRHFPNLTAYTYAFTDGAHAESEDAASARRLADALTIPFRLVPASPDDVLRVIESALTYGQDWRDFNVHCAIVNELLARAMKTDLAQAWDRGAALVLTGDLSNEFFADYAPVAYGGREYYSLPKIDTASLRRALVRGLDAGDREIGVFAHHGLDVIQPYGLLADVLLGIPASYLSGPDSKRQLAREVAGDLLPDWMFRQPKIRAQIGNARCVTGIVPTLADSGRDNAWLRRAFRDAFGIDDDGFFDRFIRAGVYRSLDRFPRRVGRGDYLIS